MIFFTTKYVRYMDLRVMTLYVEVRLYKLSVM